MGSIFDAYRGSPDCGTGVPSPADSESTSSRTPTSTSRARSVASVSRDSIATSSTAYTSPVSRPSATSITHTPVTSSPASRARSTGAAPRHRGSSEKCRLTMGMRSSTCGLMILPNATTTAEFGQWVQLEQRIDLVDDRDLQLDARRP